MYKDPKKYGVVGAGGLGKNGKSGFCTPWRSAMNLVKIGNFPNLIPNRDKHHPMMNSHTQRLKSSQLLSAAGRSGRHKRPENLAGKGLFRPEPPGMIPECFPLRREITVACGDACAPTLAHYRRRGVFGAVTEEEVVVLRHGGGRRNRVAWLWRRVHLLQHLLGECLGNSNTLAITNDEVRYW